MSDALQFEANPGPQDQFLRSSAVEVLYGGAAGGGKTLALLMGALRNIHDPNYRALILRRTFPELERSLLDRSRVWYPLVGGVYNEAKKLWRFPSGAAIEFGHLEHDHDVHAYQSAEYQYLAFDELTTFREKQYTYLLSRVRSAHGIPVRIRAATNPGGEGHEWVLRRWSPWLDTSGEYRGPRAAPGEVLHYGYTDDRGEQYCAATDTTLTRTFIPARVVDNPHLMTNDPGYVERLGALDVVTRRQLRDGDWRKIDAPGALWKHAMIDGLHRRVSPPDLIRIVVGVDPSGSAKRTADEAGIVVVGIGPCACLGRIENHGFVLDDQSGRYSPRDMGEKVVGAYHRYQADRIIVEENFGGQMVPAILTEIDPTVAIRSVHASRGKIIRAEPVAALYEAGKVHHVGTHFLLEQEMCSYAPISSTQSPGRLDALVWALTDLMVESGIVTLGEGPIGFGTWRSEEPAQDDDDDGGGILIKERSSRWS